MTLLDLMKQTSTKPGSDVRIVNVSSSAHDMHARGNPSVTFTDPAEFNAHFPPGDYDSWGSRLARYGRSKLGITLFTSELQERLDNQESSIIAVSLHPGNVATVSALKIVAGMPFFGIIARAICQLVFMSEPEGAGNVVFAAASPNVRAEGIFKGRYLGPGGSIIVPSKYAQDTELSKRLWETTERVVRSRNVI
ncbi:hypothetical protein RhiLY_05826 [Ceratobasidium sp. AG-Ba]|nr:hypothetical protein RhiLY_05826 [Ceratobasidium sp. AG-Ba]